MPKTESEETVARLAAELADARAEIAALRQALHAQGQEPDDVVARTQAERALRETAEHLAFLVNAAPGVTYTCRASGDFGATFVSDGVLAQLGYTARDFIEDPGFWASHLHPDDALRVFAEIGPLFVHDRITHEYRFRCADGAYRWMLDQVRLLRDADGQPTGMIGSWTDITDHKRVEYALAQSEARNRAMTESAHDAFLTSDSAGVLVGWNRGAEAIFGYAESEILGQPMTLLMPSRFHDPHRAGVARVAAGGPDHVLGRVVELYGLRKDGSEFPLELSLAKWASAGGWFFTGIVRDITERKRAEDERAKLQLQLEQAWKLESVGRLAGGVAHDFNNMLSVILGHAELALEEVHASTPLHQDLEEIRLAAKRSADLTRQLLTFARQEAVAPKLLDLNATVTGMLSMLRRLIGEDLDLEWRPAARLWPVHVDPSHIDQILANLCVNARDAMLAGGKLTVETGHRTFDADDCSARVGAVPGDYVRLTVGDDGAGMDTATQQRIFEPFFTTKATGKGTGLGLATVYGIVQQNQGIIDVRSAPGRGTVFDVYLPRQAPRTDQKPPDRLTAPAPRGQETILLVEDEAAILALTKRMLEQMGYRVLAAGRPSEAMRLAAEHPGELDLLVTDVIMPEMNGRDLARKIESSRPRVKCLFVSGYSADFLGTQGALGAGVSLLHKPFSKDDLAAKIRQVLDVA